MAKPEARVRAKVSVVNEGTEQRKEKNEGSYASSGGERKSVSMEEGLRSLHCLLKELGSYRNWMSQSHSFCAKTKSDLLIELSDALFEELLMQFEKLHALLRCPADGVVGINSEAQYTRGGFILLLRCCLTVLQFLEFDMTLVYDKCGILVKIIGEFFAQKLAVGSHGCNGISSINSFSHNRSCLLGGRNEKADEMPNLFSLIIEILLVQAYNIHVNCAKTMTMHSIQMTFLLVFTSGNMSWKIGCISMTMTLMNLLLFEERNLGLSKVFKNIKSHDKGLTYRSSSLMIATNLKITQKLYLKNEIKKVCVEGNRISTRQKRGVKAEDPQSRISGLECINDGEVQENHSNTCNGERFLECIPSYHKNPSQWEDLVDFIECNSQKDYLSWLKNCKKFKKWKEGKSSILKRRKWKKRTSLVKRTYDLRARKRHGVPN